VNIDNAIAYVLKHRGHKVFKRWDKDRLYAELLHAAHTRQLVHVDDAEGNVVGLILTEARPHKRELFVREVLCTKPGALKEMLAKFHEWYEGWTIAAMRGGRRVVYDTPRFIRKLEALA
jgi:hypothetical protein